MCRLLGYAAPRPTTVRSVLGDRQQAVFVDMARLHRDGWGSAWLGVDGEVHRRVRPTTAIGDGELEAILRSDPAPARITHLRLATQGLACAPENTHPFVADGMAFAHNGSVEPPHLIEHLLAPAQSAALIGRTDSERYFAAVRTRMARGSSTLDSLVDTVAQLRSLAPQASLNALLLANDSLYAVHASQNIPIPLKEFARSGIPTDELPRNHMDAYFQMRMLRGSDGSVVIASSGLDIAGWEALPADSVTRVGLDDLSVETVSIPVARSLIA